MTNDTCGSVSGRPDALTAFRSGYLPSSTIQSRLADIYTLYHSPELYDVKVQVMQDLASHDSKFPSYTSLRRTLRSSFTGEPIQAVDREDGYTLAEEIVDMTLLQPVNFDKVVAGIKSSFASTSTSSSAINFVNVGPGNVLWRSTARALPGVPVSMIDWSSSTVQASIPTPVSAKPAVRDGAVAREPIAIVGMAVKLPGAADASGLWEVLEKGLNTVSEVRRCRILA